MALNYHIFYGNWLFSCIERKEHFSVEYFEDISYILKLNEKLGNLTYYGPGFFCFVFSL